MATTRRKIGRELSGPDLRAAFLDAAHLLERQRDEINALNVFPVPDGDTGTNMLLTMRSVNEEASRAPDSALSSVTEAMARGGLRGARGNSGVILSQFLQGLAKGFAGKQHASGSELAQALDMGSKAAYKAVSKPVEGTMLTVIRELASAADSAARNNGKRFVDVWEAAVQGAKVAVRKTPEQLPVLQEAGVVDAGGQGVAVIMEGACHFFQGNGRVDFVETKVAAPARSKPLPAVSADFLKSIESQEYGYCTQLLVEGHELDADRIRDTLGNLGESVVVIGDDSMVKIHVHAQDPGKVLSYAVCLGTLTQVKIENIDEQHKDFDLYHRASVSAVKHAVLAATWGEGFARVFRSVGALGVLPSGETMNPSTQEILDEVQHLNAEQVIFLPNNPNVIPVAQQAAALSAKPVHVVPSESLPQGVAALLAYNPEGEVEANVKAMCAALDKVHTAAVTTAVRPSRVGKIRIKAGDFLCLADDKLVGVNTSAFEAVKELVRRAHPGKGGMVTLYWGGGTDEAHAKEAAAWIRSHLPGVEVEPVFGGQPLYHYMLSFD